MAHQTTISQLPQQVSWPNDGGAFITLPQVYTEDVREPGLRRSNLGMYRVQLSGNQYEPDREVGLHYQIHRGIGVHHAAALRAGKPFRVNIFVGGPPAMIARRRDAAARRDERARLRRRARPPPRAHDPPHRTACRSTPTPTSASAAPSIPSKLLPEGPFGDHLGYYSLQHDFPVLHGRARLPPRRCHLAVHRRRPAAAGRHDLRPAHPRAHRPAHSHVLPGVQRVHAVDAAGVHPLLLAIGSERYMPFAEQPRPQELLTQANAILGQGQLSLAKYLLIVNHADDPQLDIHDIAAFFAHMLERVDWTRDLHFQTETTIDTLDYSGGGLNDGSKVVIAAAARSDSNSPARLPGDLRLPGGFRNPRVVAARRARRRRRAARTTDDSPIDYNSMRNRSALFR